MTTSPIPPGSKAASGGFHLTPLLGLLLFALSVRWIYTLGIYATMGDGGIVTADGHGGAPFRQGLLSS